jgi:hypothetical protein
MMVMGGIIGMGIFTGPLWPRALSPTAIRRPDAGGLVAMCGALTFAEPADLPKGRLVSSRRSWALPRLPVRLGRCWRSPADPPVLRYCAGWLRELYPGLGGDEPTATPVIGGAIIAVVSGVRPLGVKVGARFERLHAGRSPRSRHSSSRPSPSRERPRYPASIGGGIAPALSLHLRRLVMAVTQAAGARPQRKLPRAIVLGVLRRGLSRANRHLKVQRPESGGQRRARQAATR